MIFHLHRLNGQVINLVWPKLIGHLNLKMSLAAGVDICWETPGHQCTNASCCPFDDIETSEQNLCGQYDSAAAVCCKQAPNCDWKEDVNRGEC